MQNINICQTNVTKSFHNKKNEQILEVKFYSEKNYEQWIAIWQDVKILL